ncbi:hypothetical protein BCR33DRAFT_765618 [Rhizoclosmatium globosum]|uniref:SET domain-containing protein n=1 Tax=Rhizoclosmatium globosum TaxID=329046 RepID=A0A1Y2CFW2_9FUNG|nr:hypothetical protein BCR33DRAFT_765618 [Rhizoclosmatium globosum]|eukprot:ORY45185.1 hypothetical protein BCR33DRAFT_765618 [Rhizoclosmatium globosum]
MISQARRDQIPANSIKSAIESIEAWERVSPPPNPLNPPTRDEILRYYFVVECNSFPTGLLVTLSYANHSCDPNCAVFEEDPDEAGLPTYTLTSKRMIAPGEEITISYIDLVAMVELAEDRQRRLEEHFLFYCTCEWCCSPLERIGLLKDIQGKELVGPKYEDYVCRAFPWGNIITETGSPCDGRVGKLSGYCEQCHQIATQKQLDNVQTKADRLVLNLRRTLLETNEFLKGMEDARKAALAQSATPTERPSSSSSQSTTTTEGDERIKDAATLKELNRLKKLMDGLKTRSHELLHSSHIAFGPIDACLEKVDSLIGSSTPAINNRSGKKKGGRKQAAEVTDALKEMALQ